MWTQLSNNMVSLCEVSIPMAQRASRAYSVHVFKEVYQWTNFSQITYKASFGIEELIGLEL